jgi:DNA-binding transcriptional regulator YdaS (Cro superfamily)
MKVHMTLTDWCKAEPGRQAALAEHLAVTPSAVSQACTGEIKIPPDWYPLIVDYTGGVVSYEKLVSTRRATEQQGA